MLFLSYFINRTVRSSRSKNILHAIEAHRNSGSHGNEAACRYDKDKGFVLQEMVATANIEFAMHISHEKARGCRYAHTHHGL